MIEPMPYSGTWGEGPTEVSTVEFKNDIYVISKSGFTNGGTLESNYTIGIIDIQRKNIRALKTFKEVDFELDLDEKSKCTGWHSDFIGLNNKSQLVINKKGKRCLKEKNKKTGEIKYKDGKPFDEKIIYNLK